jgi:hypothetical protein
VKDDFPVVFRGAFRGRNFASPGRSFFGVEECCSEEIFSRGGFFFLVCDPTNGSFFPTNGSPLWPGWDRIST